MNSNLLKQLRISENLSQAGMAKRIGISQTYLCQIENNKEPISDNVRRKVANHFEITEDLLRQIETLKLLDGEVV